MQLGESSESQVNNTVKLHIARHSPRTQMEISEGTICKKASNIEESLERQDAKKRARIKEEIQATSDVFEQTKLT